MALIEAARARAEVAFRELEESLAGISQPVAWGRLSAASEDEYLHTDGSIHSIVLHVASCKRIYGATAFRNGEIRWREVAEDLDRFEPDWQAALEYLRASQSYWLDSWAHLGDSDLTADVGHFSGEMRPAWSVIETVTSHDHYHAGQVAVIRYAAKPATVPPPSCAEDIRTYCRDLPTW